MAMINKIEKVSLVQEFAQAVIQQKLAIWHGTAAESNKHANRILAAFDKFRMLGNEGSDALAELFTHENAAVRSMAATFLLRYKTNEALAILREVAKGNSLTAFGASASIKRWEEGGPFELLPSPEHLDIAGRLFQ
jgi:hypothetical protein